jgi:hypothetical protein
MFFSFEHEFTYLGMIHSQIHQKLRSVNQVIVLDKKFLKFKKII